MFDRSLVVDGRLEKLAHRKEVVDKAGYFAALLLNKIGNSVFGVEILLALFLNELVC